jgi:hypothetical protein
MSAQLDGTRTDSKVGMLGGLVVLLGIVLSAPVVIALGMAVWLLFGIERFAASIGSDETGAHSASAA